ncbi:MAG: hypothetical protein M4579_004372 [Chaenotheca gracillima]|nr:MAG: hypothetical protein M4579_004372 [Chaenotheca gracillima]
MADEASRTVNLADPSLLKKIDLLFECGVGDLVDLPQLVVVGDQSSGKSSVLEGLTGLPFPRDSGLCTRFATQITFRRSAEDSISVSIIPDPTSSKEHAEKVRGWSKPDIKTLDSKVFKEIMFEASLPFYAFVKRDLVRTVMGVSKQENTLSLDGTFSKDVLRLEICGPHQDHLSVIDVPGIFELITPGVTTKDDRDLVKSMVHGYMANPRSVMLAVIPANVDVATQGILQTASEVDKDGNRTLGILTKPDIVDKGAERKVAALVEGKSYALKLGWHMVRNLGQDELEDVAIDRYKLEEEFFQNDKRWKNLDKERVGVYALRIRLQEILAGHIKREFPKVKREISTKLQSCKRELTGLGDERESPRKQASFLLDLSTRFQDLVSLALETNYGADDVFEQREGMKLATRVVSRDSLFSSEIEKLGHEYQFRSFEADEVPRDSSAGKYYGKESTTSDNQDPSLSDEKVEGLVDVRKWEDDVELQDILYHSDPLDMPQSRKIIPWILAVYQSSRGFEMGTFNHKLLATIMKTQSAKWVPLSLGYISDMITLTHKFIAELLKYVCGVERVSKELLSILMDGLVDRYTKTYSMVELFLDVERLNSPKTLNHYFNDNLEKCRQERTRAQLSKVSYADPRHGQVVRVEKIMQANPMSNIDHTCQDIHDILQAYYKVARKRFVDNVCKYAADYHLFNGPDNPLRLFSPKFVNNLTDDQLERVAGEDQAVKTKRVQLKKEIKSLEEGRKILY